MDATCAAMRGAPLCAQLQTIGCLAISGLANATDDTTTEVRSACERTRARGVALHALHCLAGGSDAEAVGMAMQACCKTAQAWRGISHRQAASIARVASAVRATTDEDYEDEQEQERAQRIALTAMQLLASLAGAPSKRTRDACAPVFVAACARTLLHIMQTADTPDMALTVGLLSDLRNALLRKLLARGCATAYAAQCAAALDADALPALLLCALRMCQDNEAVASDSVANMCAELLLPTVAALCVSSPRALRAALTADIMTVLVATVVTFERHAKNVGSAVCELLAAALTPAASDAHQAAECRAARAEATAAAVAARVPELVCAFAETTLDAAAQLARRTSPAGDVHLLAACALVSAAAQALAAYGGLLEHGAPSDTAAVLASAVATCAAAVAEQANTLAPMLVQAARDKPDATGCDEEACTLQNEAHAAACRAVAALLRVTPAGVCGVDECARVAMAALLPIHDGGAASDAVQASACGLLLQLAAACGGGEALQRLLPATTPPLAAVLTACALQVRKPALRREALRALALLLAVQLAS